MAAAALPIPPWVVNRVCTALRKSAPGEYEALLDCVPATSNFNLNYVAPLDASFGARGGTGGGACDADADVDAEADRSGGSQGGEGAGASMGGFWDTDEQEKWSQRPTRATAGKAVVRVRSASGAFEITAKRL